LKHPCELVTRNFLPAFRSLIAKGLIEDHGFTQAAAAEKLGTTQAAISHYLSSKRGEKYVKPLGNDPLVKSTIKEIVKRLAAGSISSVEVADRLCDLCMSLRSRDLIGSIQGSHSSIS